MSARDRNVTLKKNVRTLLRLRSSRSSPCSRRLVWAFLDRFIRCPKDADGLIVEAGKRVSKKYHSFEEAYADAQKLGSACTGITQNKRGVFTFGGGKDLLSTLSLRSLGPIHLQHRLFSLPLSLPTQNHNRYTSDSLLRHKTFKHCSELTT